MKTGGITFSSTCDIYPGITGGTCKAAKRHTAYRKGVYIDNPCEIIIIVCTH